MRFAWYGRLSTKDKQDPTLSFPSQRVGVIMNRSNIRQGLNTKDVESVLRTSIRFELPEDEAVQAAEGALRSYAAKGSLPSVREAERTLERILAGL